jgi:hypothetical protein
MTLYFSVNRGIYEHVTGARTGHKGGHYIRLLVTEEYILSIFISYM